MKKPEAIRRNGPAPLRIAAISYWNSRPYFHPFISGALDGYGFTFDFMVPSAANRAVLSGTHDAGLISLVAYLRGKDRAGLMRIPGLEIAAHGEAGSILLFSRKRWREIRRVAATVESETSIELLRILGKVDGLGFEIAPSADPLREFENDSCDAALLIGDSALGARSRSHDRIDLGALWLERTGRPMVYAVFAVRNDRAPEAGRIGEAMRRALEWSAAHPDALAAGADIPGGMSLANYLERFALGRTRSDLEETIEYFGGMME